MLASLEPAQAVPPDRLIIVYNVKGGQTLALIAALDLTLGPFRT